MSSLPPQRRDNPLSLAGAANLAWSPTVLAGTVFVAFHWPQPPAVTPVAAPASAWIAWGCVLAYLISTACAHFVLGILTRTAPHRIPRWLIVLPVAHGGLLAVAGWIVLSGPASAALLAGLAHTAAAATVAAALSLLVSTAALLAAWRSERSGAAPTISAAALTIAAVVCSAAALASAVALAAV